jgi:hypothetical protein
LENLKGGDHLEELSVIDIRMGLREIRGKCGLDSSDLG